MDNREKLRKYLEDLRGLAQSSASADFLRSVSNLGEFYWTLQLLAELRDGKTVDEILSNLNDVQVMNACRAIDHTLQLVCHVMMMICQIMDVVAQLPTRIQSYDDNKA